jgi:tripartite-type tricarboxylate transporter receptor subunit TctC
MRTNDPAQLARRAVAALAGAAALHAIALAQAAAQEWPTEPITIVVAYPAGGGTDTTIRAMTDVLSEDLGQPILVQNVGGAGGGVAATQVAQAEPDGYTILATNSTSITLAPLVQKALYDLDSFEHVAILGEFQNAIFANAQKPWKTLDELIEAAKAEGRPMTYASQLAIDRMLMQYIGKQREVEVVPVPVDGGNGAVQAVLAGDVDVAFSGGSWAPLVQQGDAHALFAGSHDRLKVAPDLPSMKDLGFPFGVTSHISIHAPAGTPQEAIDRLSAAFEAAVNTDMVQGVGEKRFMDMTFQGAEEATATMQGERQTYETINSELAQ